MIPDHRDGDAIISYAAPEDSLHRKAVVRMVEYLSGQRKLVRRYNKARSHLAVDDDIWSLALRSLEITPVFDAAKLHAVPRHGPLVVVANHPFGVIDGLVLCHLVSMVRQDFKVVAMSTLDRIPEIRPHVLPINFADTREAAITSARSRAAARNLLAEGGCLVIFPAGGISTSRRWLGVAEDGAWHPFTGRLIVGARATVLPVRFEGQNSHLFQIASRFSLTLRLSLLMREAASRIGTTIAAHVGDPLPFHALPSFPKAEALAGYLRSVTYATPATLQRDPLTPAPNAPPVHVL